MFSTTSYPVFFLWGRSKGTSLSLPVSKASWVGGPICISRSTLCVRETGGQPTELSLRLPGLLTLEGLVGKAGEVQWVSCLLYRVPVARGDNSPALCPAPGAMELR